MVDKRLAKSWLVKQQRVQFSHYPPNMRGSMELIEAHTLRCQWLSVATCAPKTWTNSKSGIMPSDLTRESVGSSPTSSSNKNWSYSSEAEHPVVCGNVEISKFSRIAKYTKVPEWQGAKLLTQKPQVRILPLVPRIKK